MILCSLLLEASDEVGTIPSCVCQMKEIVSQDLTLGCNSVIYGRHAYLFPCIFSSYFLLFPTAAAAADLHAQKVTVSYL